MKPRTKVVMEYSDEEITRFEIDRCAKRYDRDNMTGSIYDPKPVKRPISKKVVRGK